MKQSSFTQVKPGTILYSMPMQQDALLSRLCLLVIEKDQHGTCALILNSETTATMGEVSVTLPNIKNPLFLGGFQNADHIYSIHNFSKLNGASRVCGNIWKGGSVEHLSTLIKNNQVDLKMIRFYVGISIWENDELEEEIEANKYWWTNEVDMSLGNLFSIEARQLWKNIAERNSNMYSLFADTLDPSLN